MEAQMKFTLTYDGDLPSAGNGNKRTKEKQQIREHLSPQLAELWRISPSLQYALTNRYVAKQGGYLSGGIHHLAQPEEHYPFVPNAAQRDHFIDLCEEVERGDFKFLPLVRRNYGTICGLKILFMRQESEGKVVQGGDLDNRIKTLLDALTLPNTDQLASAPPSGNVSQPIHCLLEDDAMVSSLSVETRRLLTRPDARNSEVRLVIDVDVRVPDVRDYNTLFLGD